MKNNEFIVIQPKVDNADLIFYVDSDTTAMALKNANLKIHLADGWKVRILVSFVELTTTVIFRLCIRY